MSQLNDEEELNVPSVLVISDSNDSDDLVNGFAGFSSGQKRHTPYERPKELVRKRLRMSGDKVEKPEEMTIDIDSISTTQMKTRTKVSSDTSSKFPVSSPSDEIPLGVQRKKYVKNTLPAGAFERMLNEIAQKNPPMTYKERLEYWKCRTDLSDVEDVNNFDDEFQKREKKVKNCKSMRSAETSDSSSPKYDYQHFRTVILESLKASPIPFNNSQESQKRPSSSKDNKKPSPIKLAEKPKSSIIIHHEKILCPSSESSVTKTSPSIRLHWTDEDSVFRCNRLNPEIDKMSKLIKMRIDYEKQINLKEKMNEIFKTPTLPPKFNANEQVPTPKKTTEDYTEGKNEVNSAEKINKTSSTEEISNESRHSTETKSPKRKSFDRFPEISSFQLDEFCNYLGLGVNGKIYSPTPTDSKRRSLRVKRQQQQVESTKKKPEKLQSKKEKPTLQKKPIEKEEELLSVKECTRCSPSSPSIEKLFKSTTPEKPHSPQPSPSIVSPEPSTKISGIKIISQISNSTPITKRDTSPLPAKPHLRRNRATSNETSTCPRSSLSDDSPSKSTPRRRHVHLHSRRNNKISDLSESQQSDTQPKEDYQPQNGRLSTDAPSSENKKEEDIINDFSKNNLINLQPECMHKTYQRFLEERRKTKPSICILESIDNSSYTVIDTTANSAAKSDKSFIEQTPKAKFIKVNRWPKNRKIQRRLLRKNGSIVGSIYQRILRNRTVIRSLSPKKIKHADNRMAKTKSKKKYTVISQDKKEQNEISATEEVACVEQSEQEVNIEDPLSYNESLSVEQKPRLVDAENQTDACLPPLPITFLTQPSSSMMNPLSPENGQVIYAYYELDILTVVQDLLVTFWKTSNLIHVLNNHDNEWINLGECKRLLYDTEINAPHKNRICIHNSIPIYMEMRAKELPKLHRDCDLISVYINIYYYHDEDLVAKSHSIQLDTVASLPESVVYTTITDSRYFMMCWSQQTVLNKPRSGLCKYSLTPHLDTLASIREFKCMRHEIRYLECTTDDNLIGFGDSQITLWDHRSGDILMNYNLEIELGNNYGSIHYPPLEVGQAKTILIFQKTSAHDLSIIAINVSHNAPSHRVVCEHTLPAEFEHIKSSTQTEEYIILSNEEHQEIWINCYDPNFMMQIKTPEGQKRFYSHCKQNVINIAEDHLALETFSNFVLKMIKAGNKF